MSGGFRAMPTVALTPQSVKRLPPLAGKKTLYWDTSPAAPPWFGLRVTADGLLRSWVQGYRSKDGAEARLATLARADSVPLSYARKLGHALLRKVADGRDPVREGRERKRSASFAVLVAEYIAHGKTKKGAARALKTQGDYRRALRCDIEGSALGRRKPTEIAPEDIERFLLEKAETAPVKADRLQALVRATFRWAVRKRRLKVDPTATLDRVIAKRERSRVLSAVELAALWNALDEKDESGIPRVFPVVASAVRLLVLLGQRFGETFAMDWQHLDLAAKRWNIPGGTRKGGRGHGVPLPPQALGILEALGPREKGRVLRGPEGGSLAANPGRIKDAIDAALVVAGKGTPAVKGWTFHDLRRTCATGCAELGASESAVARLLGHKLDPAGGAVTAIYQRFDRSPEVAAALTAWGAHVAALVAGEARPTADVVPLTRGRRA